MVALDEAHEMLPGEERTEATNKATVLRNAAELHKMLCGKRGAPAYDGGACSSPWHRGDFI